LVNYWDKYTEMQGQQSVKIRRDVKQQMIWLQHGNKWNMKYSQNARKNYDYIT